MNKDKFIGRPLVIKESKFVTSFYPNSEYLCALCQKAQSDQDAIIFYPSNTLLDIFGNYRFCRPCALRLIDKPDKTIFEFQLGIFEPEESKSNVNLKANTESNKPSG